MLKIVNTESIIITVNSELCKILKIIMRESIKLVLVFFYYFFRAFENGNLESNSSFSDEIKKNKK